jgi:hypothetical protein
MVLAPLFFVDGHSCDQRTRRRCATWLLAVGIALLGVLAGGCTTEQRCEPLQRCGGDLLPGGEKNEWVAAGVDSCTDEIQLPIVPVSLSQQPAPGAGKKGVGQATADWCSSLAQKADGSLHFVPFFPIIPLKNAHLTFEPGGTYDAHFITEAPQQMAFSAACRAAQGINFTCAELGRHIKAAIASESNVYNTRCYDDGDGGCTCDYLLSLFTSLPGTYGASNDGVVTFYDQSHAPAPPSPVDYCVKGDKLELTGHEGQQLFNKPGLRTLTMHRATCSDGLQDQGEERIDCGGPCAPCTATCSDGIQNQDEKGIDCEGICPDFCGCFNKVQDPWEEGLDCGGPCSLACSCTNGVHDGNETKDKVDCGGDCQTRYSDEGPIECK